MLSISSRLTLSVVTVALACIGSASHAADPPAAAANAASAGKSESAFEQRGVHEHGRVVVNIAVEGNTLVAALEAPAINVIGFERAPRTPEETRKVTEINTWLASGVGVIGVPEAARCTRTAVTYTPPALSAADHDHDHDRAGQAAAGEAAQHADFDASYRYTCDNPAALEWVELWLTRRLLGVEALDVNLVTPTLQTNRKVTPSELRIALR